MRIGIIEAGEPPAALVPQFGTYDTMTRRLLGTEHIFSTFRVFDGQFPSLRECDAFVVTGSACSAYEKLPWIADLEELLRAVRGHARLVGICFGHQLMAQAFGGRVEKAPQGWGVGVHRYDILERAEWMDEVSAVRATASHQDQVMSLPPACRVLGASDFTPNAILSYDDHPSISVQFHPEFAPEYSRAFFEARRAPDLSEENIATAISSLDDTNDNVRLGRWISRFLAG